MTTKPEAIVEASQSLPENERAGIMEQLLATLSDEANDLTDEQLAAELERRKTELKQGAVRPVPGSVVPPGVRT